MYIDQKEILAATRGGLDIILYYYPQAEKCISSTSKKFKLRDEKTASCSIKKLADGNYVVTDFGSDSKPVNGIQICMNEEMVSFKEAVQILGERYNIAGAKPVTRKADFSKRKAKKEEKEGDYFFEIKDAMSKFELESIGKHVSENVCKEYNFFALVSYSIVKNREVLTWSSNENFPIYMLDAGDFKKIIKPFDEKQYRFMYLGDKNDNTIFGIDQLRDKYKEFEKQQLSEFTEEEDKHIEKLECAILMSGDRDAINMSSYGFPVIWKNSETATLTGKEIKNIYKYVNKIYNLPDIDATGKKQGVKLALQYMDLHTIWLPDYLLKLKDQRGYARKDFRDWVDSQTGKNRLEIQKQIDKLIETAICTKFWYEFTTEKGKKYEFSNVHAYYFLNCNGYYLIEDLNQKEGYSFIHIDGNIVKKKTVREIRAFINIFLRQRNMPIALRNMVIRTSQLSEASLSNLDMIELDFTDYSKNTQYFFFENETWKINPESIVTKKNAQSDFNAFVWDHEVMSNTVKRLSNAFEITYDKNTNSYDIDVKHTDSKFFSYLINTSRVHWKNEVKNIPENEQKEYWEKNKFNIASEHLTDDEIWEQKQHLINKIFAIGYLLHRYKNPARPWCVFAMDNKISEMRESNGGTGKSVFFKSFKYFMETVSLGGRDPKMTENKHIYERVTPYTDFLFVDDANYYLKFDFFFDSITGSMVVNPKNASSFEIPFEDTPKIGIASNYTLRNIDPSTARRILYIVFSDWYHAKTDDGEYEETRTIFDDFNKNLFFDYDNSEWNADINFFAECCRFYLSLPDGTKIEPPLGNVQKRNLISQMGEAFKDWADVYFTSNCDILLSKSEVVDDFIRTAKPKHVTSQSFKKSIKAWCQYYEYEFNPQDMGAVNGRILAKEEGKTVEKLYIQTKEIDPIEKLINGSADETDKF